MIDPIMMAILEEHGYTDTSEGCIQRVARYLARYGSDVIENDEFIKACIACNVDPYSFTQQDLNRLQQILSQLT